MIRDIAEVTGLVRADTCVIGTGFAGTEAIRTLRRAGLTVVAAEGGRQDFSKDMQELSRFVSIGRKMVEADPASPLTPYLEPKFRGEGRLRMFGGNSNIWTGKWREFEPLDFEKRPHLPGSGWPLSFDALAPFYREVEEDYGIPPLADIAEEVDGLADAVDRKSLTVSFHHWLAEPLRVAQSFGRELAEDDEVDVILGANAVELLRASGSSRIAELRCRSTEGREIRIAAESFVIATGGLEAPRLLLASSRDDPGGIGNGHDLVGRYFQDHPKLKRGRLMPGPVLELYPEIAANFPRPRSKPAFSLPKETQLSHGLLNHTLQFSPAPHPVSRMGRIAERLGLARSKGLKATFIFEQAPNRDSRVTLSDERDALGMRKLCVDWQLNRTDLESFGRTLVLLQEALAKSGIGTLAFGDEMPSIDDTIDCFHHIGTTRMGHGPETGVVDTDARVFGTDNLYVASSAVFPTGHSYAPTLTILVIARMACKAILRRHAQNRGIA